MIGKVTRTVLVALPLLVSSPLFAASSASSLTVSVEVVARTLVTVDRAPASIEISDDDVARGYVDVPQAVLFHVRSNAVNGYALQFEPVPYPFKTARIRSGNSAATVGTDGAWMAHGYAAGTTAGSLDVRLILEPGVAAGRYAWPVQFDAMSR